MAKDSAATHSRRISRLGMRYPVRYKSTSYVRDLGIPLSSPERQATDINARPYSSALSPFQLDVQISARTG